MFREILELWRIILRLTWPWSDYFLQFVYKIFMGRSKPLPAIDNKILLLPVVELAEKIRKRQLSCEEVMRAYVGRSRAVHPHLKAAVDERYEAAIKDAREADKALATGHKSEEDIARDTPLLGVPFSCKETIGVKGMAQTNGFVYAKDHVASGDSATAALYRKAGGIPYVVTNVPEACMWWESANHVFGRTNNPYDSTRSPGGSSGGEGANISAAAAIIGIGNDVGGSIRLPSSFCGIYGHKPSRGVISNKGTFPEDDEAWDEMSSTGPMCRYVQDLLLLTRILAEDDRRVRWNEKVNFRRVKVYYLEEIPGFFNKSVPEVRNSILKAVKHFEEEFGIKAVRANLPELEHACRIWESGMLTIKGDDTMDFMMTGGSKLNFRWELVKNLVGLSHHTLPAIIYGIIEMRDRKSSVYKTNIRRLRDLEKRLEEELLAGDALLLMPTQPEPPPHYLMTIPKFRNLGYTGIFNALGFPSTNSPAGMCHGVPLGIQAVGRRFQDHLTIAAAVELDKVFGGWQSPCPVTV